MNKKRLLILISAAFAFLSIGAQAEMLGVCNNENYTQYICCPAKGPGWAVSNECDAGAATYCVKDTGIVDGEGGKTILQDCKDRGGNLVKYPMSDSKPATIHSK